MPTLKATWSKETSFEIQDSHSSGVEDSSLRECYRSKRLNISMPENLNLRITIYRICPMSCLSTVCNWKRSPLIESVNTDHINYFRRPCCVTCCTVEQAMDMPSFKSRLYFASVSYQNLFWSAFSELPFCELDDFLKFVLCVGYLPNGIYYFDHTWPFKQHKSAVYTFHHWTLFTEYRLMFLLIEHLVIALVSFNKKPVPDLFTNLCSVDFDGTEHRETFWYIFYDFVVWFIPDTCSHIKSNLY